MHNKFELNKAQLNLRIGLVNLIREHVERGMTREELSKVVDSLDLVLSDMNFVDTEINVSDLSRDEQQQFYDAVF